MGVGLGITLLAATLVIAGGYVVGCALALQKFESDAILNKRDS